MPFVGTGLVGAHGAHARSEPRLPKMAALDAKQ
jgi:ketosteroid isomerase-like protein